MNLTEALHVALPDLPPRSQRRAHPRLHPRLIVREHVEDGQPVVHVIVSGANQMYQFTPLLWQLIQLFNGERSCEEVASLYRARTGITHSADEIREYASGFEEIWYVPPQEANATAAEKEADRRHQRAGKKWEDITTIFVGHWDPDTYLTRLNEKMGFVYTRWFTFLTLAFFAVMTLIFVERWSEIGTDTWKYYDFTEKGLADILEFWFLFCFLGFFHETAHGLTCKHFGGGVHKMGFLLYYLEPCFFVDVTEVYVYAGKWERIATSIAGIWVELIFCATATVLWWGTPVGTPTHDFAYKIILITGVGVAVINLNPLIKLDGYYILCELTGIVGLKEDSTAFVGSWIKKNVFRLPVEVQFVPRRRRLLFAAYSLLSGVYSYTLLYVVVRFSFNVFRKASPEWAFVPAGLLALLIFRSRIGTLVRFMKTLYLDKKDLMRSHLTHPVVAAAGALLLLVLFAPVWPETRVGRFSLEPVQKSTIYARAAGQVSEILPQEAQLVAAGSPVVRMRNLELEGRAARVKSALQLASVRANQARFHYADYNRAERERDSLHQQLADLSSQLAGLQLSSPISGVITTARPQNLTGAYLPAGTPILDVADLSALRARIYVPEFDLRQVSIGTPVSLKMDSSFGRRTSQVTGIAPVPSALEAGLVPVDTYKGLVGLKFYAVTALVPNSNGELKPGMSGTAKIRTAQRSLAGLAWKAAQDFVDRKIW